MTTKAADIREHEQVHVVDVDNGARFETYTIAGERGSGAMKVNGAAARLVAPGDKVILITYADYAPEELSTAVQGLAADMLRRSQATVSAVARNVGYTDQFAFSTAFKRVMDTSPRRYGRSRPSPARLEAVALHS